MKLLHTFRYAPDDEPNTGGDEETPSADEEQKSEEEKPVDGMAKAIDEARAIMDRVEAREDEFEPEEEEEADDGDDDDSTDDDQTQDDDDSEDEPEFDEALLARAQRFGIPRDAAKAFGDPAVLDRHLTAVAAPAPAQREAPKEEEKEEEKEPEFVRVALDKDRYDDDLIGAVDKIQDKLEELTKENRELKKAKDAENEAKGKAAVSEFESKFDASVKSANEELGGIFGAGKTRTMSPDSKEGKARNKILQAMNGLSQARRAIGEDFVFEEVFEEALNAKFGKQRVELARKNGTAVTKKKLKREQATLTERGDKRTETRQTSGTDAAISAVAKIMAERDLL